jgi:hypothetical protein
LSDCSTQTRANQSQEAIDEYAELIRDGGELDAAIVYSDGEKYHRATGGHRLEAYRAAGRSTMPCIVRQGTRWDAIQEGIKDNQRHRGVRLTNADKAHNVRLVLKEHPEMGDNAIADLVGVSHNTVSKYRHEMEETGQIDKSSHRVGRDGRTYHFPADPLTDDTDSGLSAEADSAECDTVSQAPAVPSASRTRAEQEVAIKPSRKPMAEFFTEAQRHLGRVSGFLDKLHGMTRNEPAYQARLKELKAFSDGIEAWRKEEDHSRPARAA